MDDFLEMSLLLDFYGQLLTKRQYELLDLYYNNDFSLSEISEELNISRQGVHDCIRKGKAALSSIEEKLGLVQRFMQQKKKWEEAMQLIKNLEEKRIYEGFPELTAEFASLKDCMEGLFKYD